MKSVTIRSLLALALAALLTACGGGADVQSDTPVQTAAAMGTVTVATGQPNNATAPGQAVQTNQATMPQPDCAPEGCNNLRIVDGNAEAYRLQMLERAQLPGSQGDGA